MKKIFIIIIGLLISNYTFAQENDINLLIKSGNNELALQKINNILIDHPNDLNSKFQKGVILSLLKKDDDAIYIFSELIKDYPNLSEAYNNLAVIYSNQGKFEKSQEILLNAIKINPKYENAYENLGDLYLKMANNAYKGAANLNGTNDNISLKLAKMRDLFKDFNNKEIIIKKEKINKDKN